MNVQKAIFPGLVIGILSLIGFTSLLATARPGKAAPEQPVAVVANQVQETPQASEQTNQDCSIPATYPDSVRQWCEIIERSAGQYGVDPNLISAVMLQESAGQPDAYSKSGAVGLLQVMPRDGKAASFMCQNGPCFSNRPSMQELFDPEYNVDYGVRMLAGLISRYGDVRDALKAYGPKDVGYYYADIILGILNSNQ